MKKNSVNISITGNLGNQLFQYSYSYLISKLFKVEQVFVVFPEYLDKPNQLEGSRAIYSRITSDDFFKKMSFFQKLLYKRYYSGRKVLTWLPLSFYNNSRISIFIKRIIMPRFGFFFYFGTQYFLPQRFVFSKNIFIMGYFELKSYYDKIYPNLAYFFKRVPGVESTISDFLPLISGENSVCVSIRCGDFINKYKDSFFVCDEDYFNRAIDIIHKKINNPFFVIFSDDISYVKQNFTLPENSFFESGSNTLWEKLEMMSSCKHFILSNSTFSWWGWYLSERNGGQIVVSPKSWRKDRQDDRLIEDDWILI